MELREEYRDIGFQWEGLVKGSSLERIDFKSEIKTYGFDIPQLSSKNYCLWVSCESPRKCLILKQAKVEIVMEVNFNGTLLIPEIDAQTSWEYVKPSLIEDLDFILDIDPNAFMLKDTKDPNRMILRLPQTVDSSGEIVQFERKFISEDIGLRWVFSNRSHLFVAKDQYLPLREVQHYIVLENSSHKFEALIEIHVSRIESNPQEKEKVLPKNSCILVQIEGNQLVSQDPLANCYLGYLTFMNAITPEDYQQALKYLQGARKFERYSGEELRILGWIFNSNKTEIQLQEGKADLSAPSAAIRVFSAWLVQDNLHRNLGNSKNSTAVIAIESMRQNSSAKSWELFWTRNISNEFKKLMSECVQEYFARAAHLPYGMRIEENLSPQELMDWSLEKYAADTKLFPVDRFEPKRVYTKDVSFLETQRTRRTPRIPIHSRPSEFLRENFYALLNSARSGDASRRKIVEDQIKAMRFDKSSNMCKHIFRAALEKRPSEEVKYLFRCLAEVHLLNCSRGVKDFDQTDLATAVKIYLERRFYPIRYHQGEFPDPSPVQILPPSDQIFLPSEPVKETFLSFAHTNKVSIARFQRLFATSFDIIAREDQIQVEPFTYHTSDPWMKEKIEELNEDYCLGANKNYQAPCYQLKEGQTIGNLIGVHLEAIKKQKEHYSDKALQKLGDRLLILAKKEPSEATEAIKHAAKTMSGRKKELDISECIALFLQGTVEEYKRVTYLENFDDITDLHNMIGEYILLHNKIVRYNGVVKSLEKLKESYERGASKEKIDVALQKVAEELCVETSIVTSEDPNALLVFEYALGVTLKPHQIEGIRDMIQLVDKTKFQSVLLQRIQGGGKSFVFGHIMAFLKADGYHLSIHVPATSQYHTAIYDMKTKSQQIFGQREQTFEFDDNPLKFTPEYLTWMKNMLLESIVERNYVTLTNETLRAMRCKYLKTRFEIRQGDNNGINSNSILKEILHILSERGVFTFDEMHLVLDPLKDMNMPYGSPVFLDTDESKLMQKIIILCVTLEEKVLDVHHTSQQTPRQYERMITLAADKLVKEMGWNDPQIKRYITEIDALQPKFFQDKDKRKQAQLVILARLMFVGDWLKSSLSRNVNEHHGVTPHGKKEFTNG